MYFTSSLTPTLKTESSCPFNVFTLFLLGDPDSEFVLSSLFSSIGEFYTLFADDPHPPPTKPLYFN
jgi:hypothetical protein